VLNGERADEESLSDFRHRKVSRLGLTRRQGDVLALLCEGMHVILRVKSKLLDAHLT